MMSDQQQKLSTLLDDYHASDEDRLALSDLQSDVNQQYTQQRYQMIGDVMRNELPDTIQLDFAARVKAEIAQEPALKVSVESTLETEHQSSRWWSILFKPAAGLAVAASVALVTISSLQVQNTSDESGESLATNDGSKARVEQLAKIPVVNNALRVSGNSPAVAGATNGTNWKIKRGKPEVQDKLNTYLINHNEYSNSMHGIIPQARVVGFDAQR